MSDLLGWIFACAIAAVVAWFVFAGLDKVSAPNFSAKAKIESIKSGIQNAD